MARSTRDGCPSPGPAFPRPSCCPCPGSSSASPASSPDSGGSSPAYRGWRAAVGRARLGGGQRQSASQREKLRMRRLAQALHALRHYLPASVAPAGQSLTKIETLRLAIRYIGHLSALLGLGPEPRPPPHLPEPRLAPAAPARLEREPWRAAPAPGSGPGGRAGAALLPAELPAAPPPPACQSLPDELLSFLEDFFPLAAPGRD